MNDVVMREGRAKGVSACTCTCEHDDYYAYGALGDNNQWLVLGVEDAGWSLAPGGWEGAPCSP